MFVDHGNNSINTESIDVSKLASELCFMTGCDQESAIMQLMNCNYDLQMATDKILELSVYNKTVDDGWQTINRQKKFKKKEYKIDSKNNEEGAKRNNVNRNSKISNLNVNPKTENFRGGEMQNYSKPRHKKYPIVKKFREGSEYPQYPANNSDIAFEHKDEELRWDNLADIEGGLKESSTNSVVDGFYSDDDFGFPDKSNDDSYQGIGIQLTSNINNIYGCDNEENYSKPCLKSVKAAQDLLKSEPAVPDSKILNDYLSNSLPIFGKYSKTELPKSLSIVPNKPVVFAMSIRFRQTGSKPRYSFGNNVLDVDSTPNRVSEFKFMMPIVQSNQILKLSDNSGSMYHPTQLENQILSNNTGFSNIPIHSGLPNKAAYEILKTMYKQKEEVAILFGHNVPPPFYQFNKSINMIPISNTNSIGHHMYPMQIPQENIRPEMGNDGLMFRNGQPRRKYTHKRSCTKNSFRTSNLEIRRRPKSSNK